MSYQTNFYSSSNVIVLLILSFLTIAINLVGLSYEPLVCACARDDIFINWLP